MDQASGFQWVELWSPGQWSANLLLLCLVQLDKNYPNPCSWYLGSSVDSQSRRKSRKDCKCGALGTILLSYNVAYMNNIQVFQGWRSEWQSWLCVNGFKKAFSKLSPLVEHRQSTLCVVNSIFTPMHHCCRIRIRKICRTRMYQNTYIGIKTVSLMLSIIALMYNVWCIMCALKLYNF